MKKLKILNLYAGIGGNRKLWGDDHEIIAVEINPKIANIYGNFFPRDRVVVADAHEYLLKYFKNFDFIWSSPPCPSHSSWRFNVCVKYRGTLPKYPDMKLYEEILFLQHYFKGKWVVENVRPYYEPLIIPQEIQRHCFWANFYISKTNFSQDNLRSVQIPQLQKRYGFNLNQYKLKDKRQVLRNCVLPELGLHIFKCAFRKDKKLL